MNEQELAARAGTLPEQFADRIPEPQLSGLHSLADGGEFEELLDTLLAGLHQRQPPVTAAEREQLERLLTGYGMPTHRLGGLNIAD